MLNASHNALTELVRLLGRLPGVGERTAMRHAFHILQSQPEYAQALGQALLTIHDKVVRCEDCGNFDDTVRCSICTDRTRSAKQICVVARVQDLHAMERGGHYRGQYHVLHTLLSPLDGIGPDALPTATLMRRISEHGVREVILATPLSVEGEATALYLAQLLRSMSVEISRIASGLPHGGELEYADQMTLGRALEGRRAFT